MKVGASRGNIDDLEVQPPSGTVGGQFRARGQTIGSTLCMDYALNGIGSNSCGPVVLDQYRFDDTAFRFQFELVPFVKE